MEWKQFGSSLLLLGVFLLPSANLPPEARELSGNRIGWTANAGLLPAEGDSGLPVTRISSSNERAETQRRSSGWSNKHSVPPGTGWMDRNSGPRPIQRQAVDSNASAPADTSEKILPSPSDPEKPEQPPVAPRNSAPAPDAPIGDDLQPPVQNVGQAPEVSADPALSAPDEPLSSEPQGTQQEEALRDSDQAERVEGEPSTAVSSEKSQPGRAPHAPPR